MTIQRLPGLVDPHVHLREPGATHKEDFGTGTRAALAGGFTTVLAMPNTQPSIIDEASLSQAEAAARAKAACDYGIFLGASSENVQTAADLAARVCGMKFYLDATFGSLQLKDLGVLREHFARWPKDRPVCCHAEERNLATVLLLAHLERRSVHICHVSRRAEIELIRDAKMKGIGVTCEVTPHHLFLTQADIPRIGKQGFPAYGEVRPVLNSLDDQAALWRNMEVVDCIATDHAPHLPAEKESATPPPGFPGLETSLALMLGAVHEGIITLDDVIQKMAEVPRRIFGIPHESDTWIEVDLDRAWTVHAAEFKSRCGWSPFEGWTLRGKVESVIVRDRVVYQSGRFLYPPDHRARNIAPIYGKLEEQ